MITEDHDLDDDSGEEGYPGIAHDFEQARARIAELEARLSLAEAVCKEALTEPFQSDELVEALAAWRAQKS